MDQLSTLQQEIEDIKARNKRVEVDKAWETSLFRKVLILVVTYILASLVMWIIGVRDFYISSLIPTLGFFLSTLTFSIAKNWWAKRFLTSVLLIVFIFTGYVTIATAAPQQKVSITPSPVTLPEAGGVQVFTVQLDEPIIAQVGAGYVTVNLSASDPRVQLSSSTVTYQANEWHMSKQFTVTTVGDALHNASNNVIVTGLATSNAEYYSGFTTTVSVTLADDDPEGGIVLLFGCKIPEAVNYNPSAFVLADNSVCISASAVGCKQGDVFSSATGMRCPQPQGIEPTNQSHFVFTKDLSVGMDDPDVAQLQHFLNTHGSPVAISGVASLGNEVTTFGKKTLAALAAYQRNHDIKPAIGFFGPVTRAFVNRILAGE